MDCVTKKLNILFSKAEQMDLDELEVKFKELVSEGHKSMELSGKIIL